MKRPDHIKAIFICITNKGTWGKAWTISEALKFAKASKCTEYYIQACLLDCSESTKEEEQNLFACISINNFGNAQYYAHERTPEDQAMIEKYHIGWITCDHIIKKRRSK